MIAKKKNQAMRVQMVPIESLREDPKNARKHGEKNLAAIRGSLTEFGQRLPLVVRKDVVIGGNATLRVMRELGAKTVAVVRVDDLTEAKASALAIALNRTGELAEWDEEVLASLIGEIKLDLPDLDLASLGWTEQDLDRILPQEIIEDEVPDPPKKAVTKLGDVWRLGKHRVMCCDAGALPFDEESVAACVTSPPYWGLRDYGIEGQLGLEATPEEYVAKLVEVFRRCRRVLRPDGTLWLNLGDSYASGEVGRHDAVEPTPVIHYPSLGKAQGKRKRVALRSGLKPKDLVGIPWRTAFALQADGWWLRSDIIWAKPNPMPESVTDRPTKAHEYVFLLAKSESYYFDAASVRESFADERMGNPGGGGYYAHEAYDRPDAQSGLAKGEWTHGAELGGRNIRSVWTVPSRAFSGAHFATFPCKLIEPCVKAGAPEGGVVLDPFLGAGTTLIVAEQLGRVCYGVEISPRYVDVAVERWQNLTGGKATRGTR